MRQPTRATKMPQEAPTVPGTEEKRERKIESWVTRSHQDTALLAALRAVYADAVASGKRDHPLYLSLAEQIAKLEGN